MTDITGTGGNDVLNGTSGADEIDGGAGNDIINAGAGNDIVDGGAGDDKLSGGNGDDTLDGGSGNDNLDGGTGSDILDGGSGSDTVNGGTGDDRLIYNMTENAGATDRYLGGSGTDVIELQFTFAQWASTAVQDDIARYRAFLAQRASSGEIGTPFYFTAFQLTVQQFETLEVRVDGVIINLTGNDAPTINEAASDLNETGDEDNAISGTIVATDVDFDTLSYSVEPGDEPANGTVTFGANGSYTYTPDANFNGTDSFTITVSDGHGGTDTVTVNVTVNAVNDAPTFATESDAVSVDEDNALNGSVVATDPDTGDTVPDVLTYSVEAGDEPTNGSVTIDPATGAYTYTPDADFNGSDSFTVTVTDSAGETDTITVNVTVNPVNDAPVGVDDVAVTDEDVALLINAATLLANDTDVDGDTLNITAVSNAVNGTVSLDAGVITFTPDANFNGAASFDYTVSDGDLTDTVTVNVTVNAVNDAPVAVADSLSTDEDTPLVFDAADLAVNDTDVEGDPLTVTAVSNAVNGTVSLVGGQITFTPDANFNGAASFDYTVSDGDLTDTVTVNVTVNAVNDAPVAVADSLSTDEDTPLVFDAADLAVNDTDVEGDPLTVTAVSNAVNGTVSLVGGQITFTPDANFNGAASFDYTVSDGDLTDTVTVNVTVTAVNDAPVLSDPTDISYTDTSATDNFTGVSGSLSAADLDGDSLSYSLTGSVIDNSLAGFGVSVTSTYGKMYLNTSTGAYYFEPNDAAINGLSAGSNPTADFQFTASDGALSSNTQTLTVQLTGANEAATTPTAPPVYTGTGDPNDFDGLGDPDGENLSSTATNGADTLYGGAGNDTINGGGGDDIIYGGSGNDGIDGVGDEDTLYGGSGNDTISGGNFDDTIIGGYGADALNGNNGADTFVYLSTLDTGDTISGFKQGGDADKIDLSGIDANTALANDQAFGSVVNINAVQANSVTWYYDSVSNVTRVWADVNGDTTADLQITLSGNVSLSSGDFIL